MRQTCSLVLILALGTVTEDVNADFTFGTPTNLGPTVNTSVHDLCPRISTDGLSLFFPSERPGGVGGRDIYVTTRATKEDPWGAPVNLGPTVNSPADDYSLSISADGLALYFVSTRTGGSGGYDAWVTTRPTKDDSWNTPANLGPTVNSSADEYSVGISADGRTLYFTSNRGGGSGGYDVWVTARPTTSDPWGTPVNLGPTVNSSGNEWTLGISGDGRTLFVAADRPGGFGSLDIWATRRATTNDDWDVPLNLGPTVNSSSVEGFPGISADGRMLFFSSNRSGGSGNVDLWQVPITPNVDFTGDYKVDIKDLTLLIEHWGQNEPYFDMGPTPLGDGVVDAQDLEVLMSYWGKEVYDPHFLAHWEMDETEGDVAYDSVGGYDAVVLGDAVWQQEGGQVGGALQLDGIDDYIFTPLALNPADGGFSVFAWIKGGAPGQVILSQLGGEDWLMLDAQGYLRSTLKASRREEGLTSAAAITDDSWHRIGFTWDGTSRVLYLDDSEVGRDAHGGLQGSEGSLAIGVGNDLAPGTFWSGMIDDVRIYDRVVTP